MRMVAQAVLIAVLACSPRVSAEQEFDGAAALRYIEIQISFGPRVPNTEGHRKTGDWILERLRATSDSVEVQTFIHVTQDGDTLQLRNLIGRFRPTAKERVLYVAHWDTRPFADASPNIGDQRMPVPGANDGGSGVALLLGVADVLARRPPRYGVDLVFVDGEDYGDFGAGRDVLLGSRYFAENLDPDAPKPLFAVVWDMIGDSDLQLEKEGNSLAGAPEVVERVWDKADELGYGRVFRNRRGNYITDDHLPLQNTGIRAIDVIDLEYGPNRSYWHTLEDTIDKVSAASLQIVGDVAVALLR
jgi:Zn-dependent M28 family amino/carboxypeptidase